MNLKKTDTDLTQLRERVIQTIVRVLGKDHEARQLKFELNSLKMLELIVALEVQMVLEEAGCTVLGPAGTVEQALDLIEQDSFDIALVDANLHGRPVDSLAGALQHRGRPFAFVTGYGRGGLPPAFREAELLEKPFSDDHLIRTAGRLARGIR